MHYIRNPKETDQHKQSNRNTKHNKITMQESIPPPSLEMIQPLNITFEGTIELGQMVSCLSEPTRDEQEKDFKKF